MPKSKKIAPAPIAGKVQKLKLAKLRFDLSNPRYGPDAPAQTDDEQALNYIVTRFDMADVLSSIAYNGFFDTEPLIGVKEDDGSVKILEGNRRLAACLILANDERAVSQDKKRKAYPLADGITIDTIPVIVYEGDDAAQQLLPNLGVRHIVGGKPWDSYAKAHWVATTLAAGTSNLDIAGIKAMLGDTSNLIERLVSAYHVVLQLQKKSLFDPEDTVKKGRGSANFPFSLIYNTLDRPGVRKWLKLPEIKKATFKANPLSRDRLEDASYLLKMICGSHKDDFPAAIKESRQISELARSVIDPVSFSRLKKGEPLAVVAQDTLPAYQRIVDNLAAAKPKLADANTVLSESPLDLDSAEELLPTAKQVLRLASQVAKALQAQSSPEEDV